MADDALDFIMRWKVEPNDDGEIVFRQEITIDDLGQKMNNQFRVSSLTSEAFQIALENQLVGKVCGKGVVDSKVIAWEFREPEQEFDGFEIYELQEDASYKMRAEFTAGEGLRTYVQGQIQKVKAD